MARERVRSMPTAPDFNDPDYWHQRADEARSLAERMSDETAKQTMLMVAKDYDSFGVIATTRSIDELFVRRIIDETKAS